MSVTQYQEFKVKQTDIFLQDLALNLDSLTLFDDQTPFLLTRQPASLIDSYYTVCRLGLTLSMDLKVVERAGYTILDLLSDVGGIAGILFRGSGALLTFILNKNYISNFLVTKLYRNASTTSSD